MKVVRGDAADGKAHGAVALRDAHRHFFSMSLDLFCIVGPDGIRDVNDPWPRLMGWKRAELVGVPIHDLVHPDDAARAHRAFQQLATAAPPTVHMDTRFRHGGGGYRWLGWTWTADPETGLLYGVARDRTEQRDLEELSKAIVQDVEDYAIFMLDRDGHVRTWNRGAERSKGYAAHEIVGQHFGIFYPDGKQDLPMRLLEAARRVGRAEDEGWRVRKDGTRFWANVVITAVHDSQGHVIGFTKLTRDLSERRRKENAERLAFEQATARQHFERLSRMRATLLNLVAHELRSPLTPLRLQVQLLRSGRLGQTNDRQSMSLGVLDRSITRLTRLIEDILDVSRIEAGKLALKPRQFLVKDILKDAVNAFAGPAEAEGVQLRLLAQLDIPGHGDPERLHQVLCNLIDNALQATPPGGRIEVRARSQDGLWVEIEDTGRGLTPAQQERLFEPFVQVHEDARRGSGLGLFIAHGIVERHGGTMGCTSAGPGRGATFWFHLPPPSDI